MKNLLLNTLASLMIVLFISTNINAQALWGEWGNNNQYIKANGNYEAVMIGGPLNSPGSDARLFVDGASDDAHGIESYTYGPGNYAIYGHSGGGGALAGFFFGNVEIDGQLTAQDLAINNLTSNFLQTNVLDANQVESDHIETNTIKLNGSISGNVHAGGIRIETPHGYYTELGPFNKWNSHFRTNRNQFYFYQKVQIAGSVSATALNITSDKRLKKDVSEFKYGLDEVLQLNPQTYDYTGKGGTVSGDYNVGLFAQDLQKVAPEFVTEFTHRELDEVGEVKSQKEYLRVYDTGIKYMLVNATKEQQEIIDNQAKKIETLEESLAKLQATVETLINTNGNNINQQNIRLNDKNANLEQNRPNPFSNSTLIKYNVPKDATNAVITIHNANGQMTHQERITQTGAGEIQLQSGNLQSGTYSYTLTIDGKVIDSRQMVITK